MQVGLPTLRGSQPLIARPPSTYRWLIILDGSLEQAIRLNTQPWGMRYKSHLYARVVERQTPGTFGRLLV